MDYNTGLVILVLCSWAVTIMFTIILYVVMTSYNSKHRKLVAVTKQHRNSLLTLNNTLNKLADSKLTDDKKFAMIEEDLITIKRDVNRIIKEYL